MIDKPVSAQYSMRNGRVIIKKNNLMSNISNTSLHFYCRKYGIQKMRQVKTSLIRGFCMSLGIVLGIVRILSLRILVLRFVGHQGIVGPGTLLLFLMWRSGR